MFLHISATVGGFISKLAEISTCIHCSVEGDQRH